MDNLLILITTCNGYLEKNFDNLLEQINKYNIPKKNILFVSGQEDKDDIIYKDNIKIVKVKYTGMHLSGAIYVNENIDEYKEFNYFLLLPDTIKFGENFFLNLKKYYNNFLLNNDKIKVVSFLKNTVLPTMDIGIISKEHLINIKSYLYSIKTFNKTKKNLIKLKKELINDENLVLGLKPCSYSKYKNEYSVKREEIIFITKDNKDVKSNCNGKINTVYFILLDLYKYQRNFRGPDVALFIAD